MRGWKTWFAAIVSALYGIVGMMMGWHDSSTGMNFIIQGVALIGLGHKIEKVGG